MNETFTTFVSSSESADRFWDDIMNIDGTQEIAFLMHKVLQCDKTHFIEGYRNATLVYLNGKPVMFKLFFAQ